jgi:hypothetical protein
MKGAELCPEKLGRPESGVTAARDLGIDKNDAHRAIDIAGAKQA